MPTVYLSPSTQEYNEYYDKSGSEEYYMNLIADAMVPLLEQRGITVNRNSPNMTASQSAAQSAAGENGLHLAIHSNAAGVGNAGNVRGVDVYHYTPSRDGKRAAEIIRKRIAETVADGIVKEIGKADFPDSVPYAPQIRVILHAVKLCGGVREGEFDRKYGGQTVGVRRGDSESGVFVQLVELHAQNAVPDLRRAAETV